jgi:serine protease Do
MNLRWNLCGCLFALLALTVPVHAAPPAELEGDEEQSFKEAAALVAPSVVKIETVGGLDRVDQVLTSTGPTTGVVVSSDGYIISSAFNFASKPASILVTLPDGRRLPAEQMANDKARMLTLLKVDATDLTPVQAAPPESFRVGQWAIALGRTYNDDFPNVSVGIVSALQRIWGKAIQTDAKISPMNYGGPLVDVQGRVLGILVPLSPQATGEVAGVEWYDSGIGFAIPMADVYRTLDRLKSGQDLLAGLLGVTFKGQNIYEGQPTVDRVRYGSPAQEAGVKAGDVLEEVDGQKVSRLAQVKHLLGNKYAGDEVTLKLKRGEEQLEPKITLVGELKPYESPFLGMLPTRPVTGVEAQPGAGVRFVYPSSPAAKAGIKTDDRVVKFNDTDITDATNLLDLVSRARPGDKAKLKFVSGGEEKEAEVELATLPQRAPDDLRRMLIPAPTDEEKKKADFPKTGRFTETLAANEHDYWAYVPEDYNPAHKYALVVWVHPPGDTMEASLIRNWKSFCDERGIILVGPKAKQISGWQPNEQEFIKDLVEHLQTKYTIDRSRVVVHGFAKSGLFGYFLGFKYREIFRGAAVCGAALPQQLQVPDNEPELRLQLFIVAGDKDPQLNAIKATATRLEKMKYPVDFESVKGLDQKYPPDNTIEDLARWIDALDRI